MIRFHFARIFVEQYEKLKENIKKTTNFVHITVFFVIKEYVLSSVRKHVSPYPQLLKKKMFSAYIVLCSLVKF